MIVFSLSTKGKDLVEFEKEIGINFIAPLPNGSLDQQELGWRTRNGRRIFNSKNAVPESAKSQRR